MTYYASISLYDDGTEEGDDLVFKVTHIKAEKALGKAMKFLSQKDGKSTVRRVIEFLQKDFDEFEGQLRKAIYKK